MLTDEILIPERRTFPRWLVIIAVAGVLVTAAGVVLWRTVHSSTPAQHYVTAPVERTTLAATVAATGPIAAATAVPLNFKNSGKVAEIDVKVGDIVEAGQVLAKLDPTDLQAQLRQAEANLAAAQAKLDGMLAGPRAEQVAQLQANLDTAQQKLAALQAGPRPENVAQAQANLQTAQAKLQQLKDGPTPEQRRSAQQTVEAAKTKLNSANVQKDGDCGPTHPEYVCKASQANALAAQQAVDAAQSQYDALVAPPTKEQLAQAQAAVDTAAQQLKLAQSPYTKQDIEQARAGVRAAEQALKLAQTPFTKSDLDGARAQVAAQQALVDLAQANLDSATLTAPSDGVVTAINGAVGQWLTGGSISGAAAGAASGANNSSTNSPTNFISLTDLSDLQVQAQVNEADVGRLAPGQPVSFTVDAFPGQTFDGSVAVVQPLGTTSQNVVSYRVLISVEPTQAKLLPGMTANVTVTVDKRPDLLVVPAAAISFAQAQAASGSPSGPAASANAGPAVLLVDSAGKATVHPIQTGTSDGRYTEVLSGLDAGQRVAIGVQGQ